LCRKWVGKALKSLESEKGRKPQQSLLRRSEIIEIVLDNGFKVVLTAIAKIKKAKRINHPLCFPIRSQLSQD
jgi:hypothetical protein